MKNSIKNEVIFASAGTGKTYQLVLRFINLLRGGASPESILAMTFTNKAAGEIFYKINSMLLGALFDDKGLEELKKSDPALSGLSRDEVAVFLKKIINASHLLRISTLDSFFFSVLGSFPGEFGISSPLEIQGEKESENICSDLLKAVLNDPGLKDCDKDEFLEEFKRATFGKEEKGLIENLKTFVKDGIDLINSAPEEELWGGQKKIFGEKNFYSQVLSHDELKTLTGEADFSAIAPEIEKQFNEFLDGATTCSVENPSEIKNKIPEEIIGKSLTLSKDQPLEITFKKKVYAFEPQATSSLKKISRHIVACHIINAMESTRGIYRVLKRYKDRYDDYVKAVGRMSFADILNTLSFSSMDLSSGGNFSDAKLNIDYRLDCRYDHWLIDEFQDTSRPQWKVIENLIDEVMQGAGGEKSFFYVGDIKQSIYQWRKGDPSLFLEIQNRYEGLIETRHLEKSFRSAPPIIETVNTVFNSLNEGAVSELSPAISRFRWQEHSTARDYGGYAALFEPLNSTEDEELPVSAKAGAVAEIIKEIRPFEKNLSVGILTRGNVFATQFSEELKRLLPGIKISLEGKTSLCNNMLVSALISFLKLIAHPKDRFCRGHLMTTPFGGFLKNKSSPLCAMRNIIIESGFSGFFRYWMKVLLDEKILPANDSFHIARLEKMIEIAGEFDNTGRRDFDLLCRTLEESEIDSSSDPDCIQIMTIHKAKGLDFDIVFLPELEQKNGIMAYDRDFVSMRKTQDKTALWCLKMPKRNICGFVGGLKEFIDEEIEEQVYEALCVLYVAMTRAKRALYLFASPSSGKGTIRHADIIFRTLPLDPSTGEKAGNCSLRYSKGDKFWFEKIGEFSKPLAPETINQVQLEFPVRKEKMTPSGSEAKDLTIESFFDKSSRFAAEIGTAVHEIYSLVEWACDCDPQSVFEEWRQNFPCSAKIAKEAEELFLNSIAGDRIKNILKKPDSAPVELWREKSFQLFDGGDYISGTFDRVVVVKKEDGTIDSARILDFKTDAGNIDSAVEKYRPQMEMYKRSLSRMLGIQGDKISTSLVFLRHCEIRGI
jgi:ATP-dependent helicase/nuclease subunit A